MSNANAGMLALSRPPHDVVGQLLHPKASLGRELDDLVDIASTKWPMKRE
jgi:hypothetical protein